MAPALAKALAPAQVWTVAALCLWQPFNVLRHAAGASGTIVAHFGVDGAATSLTMPFPLFATLATGATLLLGAAFVLCADRALAARQAADRWLWLHQSRAAKIGECAAHALFCLGAGSLLLADLVVWAVLEANEEATASVPPRSDCVPCAVFVPVYLTLGPPNPSLDTSPNLLSCSVPSSECDCIVSTPCPTPTLLLRPRLIMSVRVPQPRARAGWRARSRC